MSRSCIADRSSHHERRVRFSWFALGMRPNKSRRDEGFLHSGYKFHLTRARKPYCLCTNSLHSLALRCSRRVCGSFGGFHRAEVPGRRVTLAQAYASFLRGSGIGRTMSRAVSIHSAMTSSALAMASLDNWPSAMQQGPRPRTRRRACSSR